MNILIFYFGCREEQCIHSIVVGRVIQYIKLTQKNNGNVFEAASTKFPLQKQIFGREENFGYSQVYRLK